MAVLVLLRLVHTLGGASRVSAPPWTPARLLASPILSLTLLSNDTSGDGDPERTRPLGSRGGRHTVGHRRHGAFAATHIGQNPCHTVRNLNDVRRALFSMGSTRLYAI